MIGYVSYAPKCVFAYQGTGALCSDSADVLFEFIVFHSASFMFNLVFVDFSVISSNLIHTGAGNG